MRTLWLVATMFGLALLPFAYPACAQAVPLEEVIRRGRAHEAAGDSARDEAVRLSSRGERAAEAVRAEVEAYERAILDYTLAISLDSLSAEAYRLRALAQAKRDRDGNQEIVSGSDGVVGMVANFGPEAVEDADRAISLAPADPQGHLVRGEILAMQFRNTWDIYTGMPEGTFGRSMMKPDPALANGAIDSYSRAVELDPGSCQALAEIGRVYFLGFKFEGALDYFTRAEGCGLAQDPGLLERLTEIAAQPSAFFPSSMLDEFEIRYPPGR
ncbi:MAG: hypothetical protein OER90_04370 [Gemmatimonadota bacterium]|nr:hypothetical protein [Gemmatimonadota bacterium]